MSAKSEITANRPKTRIFFIEMMGVPGSYDASVYDHFEDKDNEGEWFVKRYGNAEDVSIQTRNVCIGEPMPGAEEVDGVVLAGSYNSVHDDTDWQRAVINWFSAVRTSQIPVLGVCGSHQLLGHFFGGRVVRVKDGPYAGTFRTSLTPAGRNSPLFAGIEDLDSFHYANGEHLAVVPTGATLLAHTAEIPVAALDFGGQWYSTQFHPEASAETLGTIWRNSSPELCDNYSDIDAGDLLVSNFFNIVRRHTEKRPVT